MTSLYATSVKLFEFQVNKILIRRFAFDFNRKPLLERLPLFSEKINNLCEKSIEEGEYLVV